MRNRPDDELYRRMRGGDDDAFTELYRRHEGGLFRYALHVTADAALAEEIAQEVFVRLIDGGGGFDPARGALDSYLYGVARNLVRESRRRPSGLAVFETGAEDGTLGRLMAGETERHLHAAIQDLPERYRDVVVLCDLEERSYEDAARILGCPVGTVRSRLHRARASLAGRLKPAAAGVH